MPADLIELPADLDPGALLDALRPEAEALEWAAFDVGEVVVVADGVAPPEVERMVLGVDESTHGVPVSFDELVAFVTGSGQIIDGVFSGTLPGVAPPARADDDATVLGACATLVAVIDSGCWLVSASTRVADRLRDLWPTADVAPSDVTLSVWGR